MREFSNNIADILKCGQKNAGAGWGKVEMVEKSATPPDVVNSSF